MNRYRVIWVIIVIIFIAYFIFAFPITINKEMSAVKYRLGDEVVTENITIKIDGRYIRRLFSSDIFKGKIYIKGYEFTDDSSGFENLKSTLDNIHFVKNGYGMYRYVKNNTGSPQVLMQGSIFIKNKFTMLSMTIMERNASDSSHSSWNSEDGLMISAPAKTRQEALNISNSLMTDIAKGNTLK